MADIEKLIQDLQSDNPGKRYQACNELFYAQSIPESAIEALNETTQDSDPAIANAAQRALNVHVETSTFPQYQLDNEYSPTPITDLIGVVLMVWAGISAVIINFVALFISSPLVESDDSTSTVVVFFIISIIPAFLTALLGFGILFSKRNTQDSQIGVRGFIFMSTAIGVISGIFWQLVFILIHSL
jgi:hypothetical protein